MAVSRIFIFPAIAATVVLIALAPGRVTADDNPWRRVYNGSNAASRADFAPMEQNEPRSVAGPADATASAPAMKAQVPSYGAYPPTETGGAAWSSPSMSAPGTAPMGVSEPGSDQVPDQSGYAYSPPPAEGYAPPPYGGPQGWDYAPAFDPYSQPSAAQPATR